MNIFSIPVNKFDADRLTKDCLSFEKEGPFLELSFVGELQWLIFTKESEGGWVREDARYRLGSRMRCAFRTDGFCRLGAGRRL